MRRRIAWGALSLSLALSLCAPVQAAQGDPLARYDRVGERYPVWLDEAKAVAELDGKYALVGADGQEWVPLGTYPYLDGCDGGVVVAGTGAPRTTADGVTLPAEKFGLLDLYGHVILPLGYDYIWPFDGRTLAVLKDGQAALYRPDGTVAVPFQAVELEVEGGAYRRPGLTAPLPDLSACPELEVTWFPGYELAWTEVSSGGMVAAKEVKSGRYGILDAAGAVVVPCTYDTRIWGYNSWSDRAEINCDWGMAKSFFDASGELVETPYSQIEPFHLDRALVVDAETTKVGFIDRQYREVIPCVYDRDDGSQGTNNGFQEDQGGYTVIAKDGVPGLLDLEGNFSIPAGHDGVISVSAGGTRVVAYRLDQEGDRRPALLDQAGDVLIPAGTYDTIYPFVDGLAVVVNGEAWSFEGKGRCGVVGLDGRVVVPVEYAGVDIRQPDPLRDETQAYVWTGEAWGLYAKNGDQLLPCTYNQGPGMEGAGSWDPPMQKMYRALHDGADPVYLEEYQDGLVSFINEAGGIGFRDQRGDTVVPAVFDGICGDFANGWCALEKDGVWGLVKNPLYRDKVSSWAQAEVAAARESGLLSEGGGTYLTYPITRSQLADLLERATGRPAGAGTEEGDALLTREGAAVMLDQTLFPDRAPVPAGLSGYTDADQVSDWAREAVAALAAEGVMKGTSADALSPKDPVTVEQAVLLVLRAGGVTGGA